MFFFLKDTATTEIYTLSLHDALPISPTGSRPPPHDAATKRTRTPGRSSAAGSRERSKTATSVRPSSCHPPGDSDRKSTRLNSSHANISYAVFCLKKKNLVYPSPTTLS